MASGSSRSCRNTRRGLPASVSGKRTASYIDVQYVVKGVERIGHVPITRVVERTPYDPERDVTLYERGESFVTLPAGSFAIFGPDDVHSPCVSATGPASVRKVVVKASIAD